MQKPSFESILLLLLKLQVAMSAWRLLPTTCSSDEPRVMHVDMTKVLQARNSLMHTKV